MMGGLRYADIRELPEGYQQQVVAKIVEKVAAAQIGVSAPSEAIEDGYDPCLNCLRWGECNGVDDKCPWR